MIVRKLSAGDIVESRCTRCRKVLNHTIVAMVGEQVVRVECNTCGGIHNYHPAASAKTASPRAVASAKPAAPRKAPGKTAAESDRDEWESLRPHMDQQRAIEYDMNGIYRLNDLVAHPVFGLGVVKLVVPSSKMEVLFQTGRKLLRCH